MTKLFPFLVLQIIPQLNFSIKMKIQKLLAIFSLAICISASSFSQLNVIFRSQLTYPGKTCANIYGYVDSIGNEYALVGVSTGMSIVDVTNPSVPVEVIQIPGVDNLWKEIKVYGKYAYVTTEGGGGLQIVNMSSLPNVAGITYQNYTGDGSIAGTLNKIHALHIDGSYIYLYGSNLFSGGAVVCDLTDPWNPVYVGNYQSPSGIYVHDGYVRNDTLYAGHISQGFFSVVDFTNKAAPVELATQFTPTNFTHNTWLSTNSKYLFTTDETTNSFLTSYDITDLGNIIQLDKIQSNPGSGSIVHNTHIINVTGNDYAVTSWYRDGFTIVDAGRPQNLVQVGNYDTYPAGSGNGFNGDWGVYPFLPSGTIVVSNIDEGLFVFSPTYVRACYLEGVVNDSVCGALLNNVNITVVAAGINDLSDISGIYRTGTPTPGTYNVTFSKSGYITKVITGVILSPGIVNNINVALAPINTVNVTGLTSNNVTSTALANVNVYITDAANSYSFVSDGTGNFGACNVVSANDYNISVGIWGYKPICLTNQDISTVSSVLSYALDPGYYDDFTFNLGWTISGTASTGTWERGVPIATFNGPDASNPGVDDSTDCNDMAYITGNGGGSVGTDDVDDGYTLLTSPVFDLTGYTQPYIDYTRWFYAGGGGGTPNDSLTIYLSNGISTVMIEFAISTTPGNSTWIHKSYKVSDFIVPTATMRIMARAVDKPLGHLVEAGFDKFLINEGPTGIAENKLNKNTLAAFPNPFTNETTIEYNLSDALNADATINITDITGRLVQSQKVNQSKGVINIQISINAGIYFVNIKNGNEITGPVKIVKMK